MNRLIDHDTATFGGPAPPPCCLLIIGGITVPGDPSASGTQVTGESGTNQQPGLQRRKIEAVLKTQAKLPAAFCFSLFQLFQVTQ